MTTSRTYGEHEGDLGPPAPTDTVCLNCGSLNVLVRVWSSHDGAYEDFKYHCTDCRLVWWVDGIDS